MKNMYAVKPHCVFFHCITLKQHTRKFAKAIFFISKLILSINCQLSSKSNLLIFTGSMHENMPSLKTINRDCKLAHNLRYLYLLTDLQVPICHNNDNKMFHSLTDILCLNYVGISNSEIKNQVLSKTKDENDNCIMLRKP